MGAWSYVSQCLPPHLGGRRLGCVARPPSASPAAGSATHHKLEQEGLVEQALTAPAETVAA